MKKIYLSVVCLLISIPLIAQLYVEPEKEVECSVFLAKEGRGRAQQGLEIWDDYIFSCEDGGHVNIYDFKSADPKPVAGFELASSLVYHNREGRKRVGMVVLCGEHHPSWKTF